ncbi:MAG: ATP synthase F1 subunit delta [Flavobacteriales bacterium]|nr:ATP synthase F1 subunit delta [Flavobacteriales bacterium]
MKGTRATIRYAKALLQLSVEKDYLSQSYNDMVYVDQLCSEIKDFVLLLKSPIVKTDLKLRIINEVLNNKVSETSLRFINIITGKKRESLLPEIVHNFIELYKAQNNIQSATVTTAVPLSSDTKKSVLNYIKNQTKSTIELKELVDESIIGGAIIKMGDKQLDASVSKEILELKQIFNQNLYLQDF